MLTLKRYGLKGLAFPIIICDINGCIEEIWEGQFLRWLKQPQIKCERPESVRAQFLPFKLRLLTSQESYTHSLSHGNPITPLTPIVFLPPLRFTHQDEHRQEQNKIDYIPELSEDNDNN